MNRPDPKFTIVVAEDHPVVRDGIRFNLRGPRFEIVEEVDDGRVAIEAVRKHQPDLIVLDISLRNCSGTEALAAIKRGAPKTRLFVFTEHRDFNTFHACLLAGVHAYVVKGDNYTDFATAVLAVLHDECFVSPIMTRELLKSYQAAYDKRQSMSAGDHPLTIKQIEIVRLLSSGKTYKQIGEQLNISNKTAANHASQAMKKLGVPTRAELVSYAISNGLVQAG